VRLLDSLRGVTSVPYPMSDWSDFGQGLLQTYYGGPTATGERVSSDFLSYARVGYQGNGVVFSVLNARLRLFSEATAKFRALADKRLFGNADLALIENPWPGGSTSELLGRMIQDADLAGNSFIRRVDSTRLERLRPDWVQIVSAVFNEDEPGEYCEVIGYLFADGGWSSGEDPVFYPVDEVAHWSPIPDPLAKWRGMSWLTPVVRDVNADLEMTTYRQKFFDNAATPNMVVKYKGKVGATNLTALIEQLNAKHGGSANAFKTLALDEGADMTVVGNNFAEMAFTELQAAGEVRIASAGGVPPIVAGLQGGLDASTMANYAAAYRNFADSTMHVAWRGAFAVLAKFVTVPDQCQLWFDTRDIPALRDEEFARQRANAQLSIAVMNLVNAGFDADSVTAAVVASDMSLLKHTGLVSVQLQKPGTQLAALDPPADPSGGPNDA
jgi:phage portal protein BeeE